LILPRAQVDIDLGALVHNFSKVRELVGSKRSILSMIKANAYGHGLQQVALALNESDAFGVANVAEAIELREIGVAKPIIVMAGFLSLDELALFSQHQLTPVIHHESQVEMLEHARLLKPISVRLKLDSGMARLGFEPTEYLMVLKRLQACATVVGPVVLMTHFADADNNDKTFTELQTLRFMQLTTNLSLPKSMANSAAILSHPHSWADWVRPGLILYGGSPFLDKVGKDYDLRPVMTLSSRLIAVKQVRKGESVGYGCTWQCPHDTKVAIVAIGYGDGYPRHARHGTPVSIHGQRCELLGRVSMDMIAVDVSQLDNVDIGDRALLWGDGLPIEEIARCADTIPYELMCSITQRVERQYKVNGNE